METRAGEIAVHYVEHGAGRPVLVLHGAGVDHRDAEACFEPVFGGVAGFRRIYPDLPGLGRTVVSDGLRSAEAREPGQVAGLALVCPPLPGQRDVPENRVVVGSGEMVRLAE